MKYILLVHDEKTNAFNEFYVTWKYDPKRKV